MICLLLYAPMRKSLVLDGLALKRSHSLEGLVLLVGDVDGDLFPENPSSLR